MTDGGQTQVLDEATFVEHCREGKVTDAAMVWTSGMNQWQTFAEMRAAEEAAATAAARRAAQKQAEEEAAAKIERQDCAECGKSWPVAFMVTAKNRALCRPCDARLGAFARLEAERKAAQKSDYLSAKFLLWFSVGAATLSTIGYFGFHYLKARWEAPPTQAPEKWVELAPREWPQIVLPGETLVHGAAQAARTVNNFLLVDEHSRIVGIGFTRAFATPAFPGGRPAAPDEVRRQLRATLASWSMGVGAGKTPRAVFTQLHGGSAGDPKSEAVMLDAAPPLTPYSPLPAAPLRVRALPFQKDMKIFVVGTLPIHPGEKQSVYTGKLHGTLDAQRSLDLEMDAPINPDALVGSPVLDEGGHLTGVVNGTFDTPDKNGQINTLSAESLMVFAGPLAPPTGAPKPGGSPAAPADKKKTGPLAAARAPAKTEK